MLILLLVVLIILWAAGYLPATGIVIPDITFFVINGYSVTLLNFIALAVISWIIGILPHPFRLIASILLVVWALSVIGVFAFAGLSQWLMLTIIVGLLFYVIRSMYYHTPEEHDAP